MLQAQRLADFQSLAFDAPSLSEDVQRRPSGLPTRNHRLPRRYRDDPPSLPIPVPTTATLEEPEEPQSDFVEPSCDIEMDTNPGPSPSTVASAHYCTITDGNDLFRQYQGCFPSYDPENSSSLEELCDSPTFQRCSSTDTHPPGGSRFPSAVCLREKYFTPFLNATAWRLMSWFYSGSNQKSLEDLNSLVHKVILADDFVCEDLCDFSAQQEAQRLDNAPCGLSDGWNQTTVSIRLPCEGVKQPENNAPEFQVEGLYYRKITEVVKSAFTEPAAEMFHIAPYKLYWQPDKTRSPERIITELYTSDAMLQEHERIRTSPQVPGCTLETVVAAIMLWSDSTHLASFGNAALWPIYLFLGNQSKYTRARPSSFAAHHLAYIPKELNARFRLVPTFGRDTIRKFSSNVSSLTKLAARDFEDILQCTIPVFDGLLPEPYNSIILDLLFELATWHAFGKLRMHTETTIFHFGNCTTRLGQVFRKFSRECCAKFNTYDLPRETAARARRSSAKNAAAGVTSSRTSEGHKPQRFNMSTYKLHALGDYVKSIWQFGTTDNYSTQVGELEHRRVKRFYSRMNKINFTVGIAKHQQRERLLHRMCEENHAIEEASAMDQGRPSLHFVDQEPLPNCPLEAHYQISASKKYYWDLGVWLSRNKKDMALENFLPKLKNHILAHLMPGNETDDELEFTQAQQNALGFINNRIYRHKVLRINYTTYDLRRAQDSLNPHTHSDIMVLSQEDSEHPHPYWYARIIGIFHVDVQYYGPELVHTPRCIDFLWQPFTLEYDRTPLEERMEGSNKDDAPMDDSSSAEEESGEESDDDMSEMEGVEDEDDEPLVPNELVDEMDEYGYSGLEQVLDADEWDAGISSDEDAFGPEDREDPSEEVEEASF
ncbi:hypothetical protein ID866_9463 [Astraeus odoratus]|nr:hypothetical protein ID866_9463 [Astraeus odoratus]